MKNTYKINMTLSWLSHSEIYDITTFENIVKYFHGVGNIWDNFDNEASKIKFLNETTLKRLIYKKRNFAEKFYENIKRYDFSIINLYDKDYPEALKYISNPPYILFLQGDLSLLKKNSIAIVGSRKATSYGKFCARKFSMDLSRNGITVISGMAKGIDGIAHRTALENHGNTIGVIASGLNINYPQSNRNLYEDMKKSHGLIMSEFYFDTPPLKYNFPLRNRIISGLSDGLLVIEAAKSSGTLITAGYAAEQGKTVFAVPGNIDSVFSVGTNMLIKDGAKPVSEIQDILEEFEYVNWTNIDHENRVDRNKKEANVNLNEVQSKIMSILQEKSLTITEISNVIKCDTNDLLSNITLLELQNIIYVENNIIYANV